MHTTICLPLAVIMCLLTASGAESGSGGWAFWPPIAEDEHQGIQAESPSKGQGPVEPAQSAASAVGRPLNIMTLVGNGTTNIVSSKLTSGLVLEVRDHRNLPVEGAEVMLQLPASGPSGHFPGGQLTWTGTTDANGQVVVSGFTPNQERGRFEIRVTAKSSGAAGTAIITQANSTKPPASRRSRWWKIGIVAAACGATAGIVLATHGSGDKSTVVLQPGTVSVGAPR
jgi:hypothetical protein